MDSWLVGVVIQNAFCNPERNCYPERTWHLEPTCHPDPTCHPERSEGSKGNYYTQLLRTIKWIGGIIYHPERSEGSKRNLLYATATHHKMASHFITGSSSGSCSE